MRHIAIDLGGRESQICVREPDGKIAEERRQKTATLGSFLQRQEPARVILETSAEASAIARVVIAAGHDVRVVPATLAPSLGVGAHGVKNDRRDAQNLSLASCRMDLPSVHIPSLTSEERRSMVNSREGLVTSRTQLMNLVSGDLRRQLVHIRSGKSTTFAQRVRDKLEQLPQGISAHIESVLSCIEKLNEEIKNCDRMLSEIVKNDTHCRRAMSMPGIGPINAVQFVATIDELERFKGPHLVESYLGLTPGENSSSQRIRKTSITKAGSARMRHLLVQGALTAMRVRPNDPMVLWAKKIEQRSSKQVAIVALARKMAGILFAMLRDGTAYDPNYAKKEEATEEATEKAA